MRAIGRRAMVSAALHRTAIRSPPEPRMIMQVKFVSIPVRDQDRALAFYTEKMG